MPEVDARDASSRVTRPLPVGGVPLPIGLQGAVALVWGIQCDYLVLAVVVALTLEAAPWSPLRFQLSRAFFNRVADVSAVALLILVVHEFREHSFLGVVETLKSLPLVLFPLAVAQGYSTAPGINLSSLFLSVRWAEHRGRIAQSPRIDFSNVYLVCCFVAATASAGSGIVIYLSLAVLLLWTMWANRPARARTPLWLGLAVAAVGIGYVGQLAMLKARGVLEPMLFEVMRDHVSSGRDPYRGFTAMGHIGRLKLSDRIVLRVGAKAPAPVPHLLREATYHTFSKNLWLASKAEFHPAKFDATARKWRVGAGAGKVREVTISKFMHRGQGLLAVPSGALNLQTPASGSLLTNAHGVLKFADGPDLLQYQVDYLDKAVRDPPPNERDRLIPSDIATTLSQIVVERGLDRMDGAAVLQSVADYFNDGFSYALELDAGENSQDPISDFLLKGRRGHCEYFASATVLMLRAAGVPARYATGFSVQEWSELEQQYVVRSRHSHAWAIAFVDGAWRNFDTTPDGWYEEESKQSGWWQPAADLLASLAYRFSQWRANPQMSGAIIVLLVLATAGGLAWMYRRQQRRPTRRPQPEAPNRALTHGADSEFYAVIDALSRRGLGPAPGEPLRRWTARLAARTDDSRMSPLLDRTLRLHYQLRFDPDGLAPAQRDTMRELAKECTREVSESETATPRARA